MTVSLLEESSHAWTDCYVSYKESYRTQMVDFHSHDYYEISLILSGNVKSLLLDRSESGSRSRLVLTAPHMPHFISLESPDLYSRINLCFSSDFIVNYVPEWPSLSLIFGQNGNILLLDMLQRDACRDRLLALKEESNPFRRRLRILEFISYISEFDQSDASADDPPPYVLQALTYINEHSAERIVAASLAWELNVGRTTLMTAFRKYTGTTLNQYIVRVRLEKAVKLLKAGMSQHAAAELTGFGNGSVLNRAFHKHFGATPKEYFKNLPQRKES